MKIRGAVWTFGDNINTDEIIAARYLSTFDEKELGAHCMEDIDPEFPRRLRPGDIIVAKRNFGCGSSREHAPIAIKGCGIACVVAESFARIFYRNAINIGLPILVSPEAAHAVQKGDLIEIDTAGGSIRNLTRPAAYVSDTFPEFMQELIDAGGLLPWVKQRGQLR